MISISIILPVFQLVIAILVFSGLNKTLRRTLSAKTAFEKISVIIPFKNEKDNLPGLLNALNQIDYPEDKFEIIFVDDNSSDDSYLVLNNYSGNNYKILNASNKKYPGKKGVIDVGISNSQYDLIAITDADCEPQPNWLNSISAEILNGSDIVFGYSPLKKEKSLVSKISSFENFRNYILYFSASGLGIPYSATSRSIAFRKDVYFKLNGYSKTLETLSGDDDLFIREAVKQKLKISAFLSERDFVYSNASKTFKEYFSSKSRHLKTSHHYLFRHQILLAIWHSINIISIYSIALISLSELFLLPFFVKMIVDLSLSQNLKSKLQHDFKWYEVLYLQPIYETFLIFNFLNSLFRKDKWK